MRLILALLAAASLTGCAFTSESIDIPYTQQQGVAQVPGADGSTVSVDVTDARSDKSRVSSKKNGYGMETAPITANENVSLTIERALEQEIRARGFRAGSGASDVKVNAEINRFYNDHKMGFFSGDAIADLNLTVKVYDNRNTQLYSRAILVQGKEENTQMLTGNNASKALSKALSAGMAELFNDASFIAALKHPATGPLAVVAGQKTKSQLLDDLAADKSLSYEEYQRRYSIIMRQQ